MSITTLEFLLPTIELFGFPLQVFLTLHQLLLLPLQFQFGALGLLFHQGFRTIPGIFGFKYRLTHLRFRFLFCFTEDVLCLLFRSLQLTSCKNRAYPIAQQQPCRGNNDDDPYEHRATQIQSVLLFAILFAMPLYTQ